MEPLTTTTATALGIVLATKAVETIGGKVGDALWSKVNQFLDCLRKESPNTVKKIEEANEQELDSKIILEVEYLAQNNPKIAQLIEELTILSKTTSLPQIFNQNIEKAVNAAQHIDNRGSTFNINL